MPKLLLVDDDPRVARTLLDILSLHGYPAVRAESGEQALERLEREPFDLVILDVRMPGLDGFQTCSRIRERFGPSLPVIILPLEPNWFGGLMARTVISACLFGGVLMLAALTRGLRGMKRPTGAP